MTASRLVTLTDGGQVELTDWSVDGVPLLFLAGMTHTARVFDFLAQHFTTGFRCVGLTRRGFGRSSNGDGIDGVSRLAHDIIEVIEQCQMDKAVLVGHSFGCREIEIVCRLRPALVRAVVLIDGAYDYSADAGFMSGFEVPGPPAPGDADLNSVAALGAWYVRTFGARLPAAEIRAMYEFDESGRCLGQRTDHMVVTAAVTDIAPPCWSNLPAKVLAVFAKPDSWQVYAPGICELEAQAQHSFAGFFEAMVDYREAQIDAFAEALPDALIGRPVCSNHYVHLSHEWLVVRWMQAFLSSLQASEESTIQAPRNELR